MLLRFRLAALQVGDHSTKPLSVFFQPSALKMVVEGTAETLVRTTLNHGLGARKADILTTFTLAVKVLDRI